MRVWLALFIGAAIAAVVVACGGATARKAAAPPMAVPSDAGMPGGGNPRSEIQRLQNEIAASMGELKLPVPPESMGTNPTPVATSMRPSNDPTCKPAETDTCKDSCKLADSICDNAKKICEIAATMNDDWANGKCNSGNQSCDAARGRCCNCQL
jgi:hypothetical protein